MDFIAFDLDGTLVDGKPVICRCHNETFVKAGLKRIDEKEIEKVIGRLSLREGFRRFFPDLSDLRIDNLVKSYRELYKEICDDALPYPGVPEVIRYLAERNYLAIASIKRADFLEKILEKTRLRQYFLDVAGMDKEGESKTDILKRVLANTNIAFRKRFMTGDAPEDIRAAKANGLLSIAATYGYSSIEDLRAEKPDFYIHTPMDILRVI